MYPNIYSIPDEKRDIFTFLCYKITELRESIPYHIPISGTTNIVYDYKSKPDVCVKITIIINYLHNITKNKISLKRALGTVYDLYETWVKLCEKAESYRKPYLLLLKNNNYLQSLITQFNQIEKNKQKIKIPVLPTKPIIQPNLPSKDIAHSTNFIDLICEKYIQNLIERKTIHKTLQILGERQVPLPLDDLKLFLLEIGEKFPLYILETIFGGTTSRETIKFICNELGLKLFWNLEKRVNHGKNLGKQTDKRPKRILVHKKTEKEEIIQLDDNLPTVVSDAEQISILPSGDLQIIVKYGTEKHKTYLSLLNDKKPKQLL